MSIVTGNKIGDEIAEIFNLPNHILSIRLVCEPSQAAKLIVEFAVTTLQSDCISSIMKEYKIVETGDANGQ